MSSPVSIRRAPARDAGTCMGPCETPCDATGRIYPRALVFVMRSSRGLELRLCPDCAAIFWCDLGETLVSK